MLYINSLVWMQTIISLACFAYNVIHPWPHMTLIFDGEIPPGLTPTICLCHNCVCISTLKNLGNISNDPNFQNIALDSHSNFWKKLSKSLTAQPQKPKLS